MRPLPDRSLTVAARSRVALLALGSPPSVEGGLFGGGSHDGIVAFRAATVRDRLNWLFRKRSIVTAECCRASSSAPCLPCCAASAAHGSPWAAFHEVRSRRR